MKFALVGPELEENLGLRYLHSSAINAGHEGKIFPFSDDSQLPSLVERLIEYAPDCIGCSMVFTARAREFILLAELLRKRGYAGLVVAGGHFASFHSEQLLSDSPYIDVIVHGEGETVFTDVLNRRGSFQEVAGISYRDKDGSIHRTEAVTLLGNLDLLPPPTRTPPFHCYLGKPIADILGSRGCYGSCTFCSIAAWFGQNGGKRFRQRSVESVAAEMANLYYTHNVRIFNFHDDNFFFPREEDNCRRFNALGHELEQLGMERYAIQVKARTDSITEPVVRALRRIGLFRVFLGVENNSPSGLLSLGKGTTVGQNNRALGLLAREGIHVSFNLLMFGPDTTMREIEENIGCIRAARTFPVNFGRTEVYTGTALEKRLRNEGRLKGNYLGYYYEIADRHVQQAFEMFRAVFTERNFTMNGMNHQAMSLDYHFHILKHFYPRRVNGGLHAQVRKVIAGLNDNSARLLEKICETVICRNEQEQKAVAEKFLAERRLFDRRAAAQCAGLIAEIERRAARSETVRFFPEMATALGAAALLVTVTGCSEKSDTGAGPDVITEDPGSFEAHEFAAIRQRIEETYRTEVDSLAQRLRYMGEKVVMNLSIDSFGKVSAVQVLHPDIGENSAYREALESLAVQWEFPAIVRHGECSVMFATSRYVKIEQGREWHYAEMIAYPVTDTAVARFDSGTVDRIKDSIAANYQSSFDATAAFYGLTALSLTFRMTVDTSGWVSAFTIISSSEAIRDPQGMVGGALSNWRFSGIERTGWCEISMVLNSRGSHMMEMMAFSADDTTEFDTTDQLQIYNKIMDDYQLPIDALARQHQLADIVIEWGMTVDKNGTVRTASVLLPVEPATIAFRKELEKMIREMRFPGLSRSGWCRFNMIAGGTKQMVIPHMCEIIPVPVNPAGAEP